MIFPNTSRRGRLPLPFARDSPTLHPTSCPGPERPVGRLSLFITKEGSRVHIKVRGLSDAEDGQKETVGRTVVGSGSSGAPAVAAVVAEAGRQWRERIERFNRRRFRRTSDHHAGREDAPPTRPLTKAIIHDEKGKEAERSCDESCSATTTEERQNRSRVHRPPPPSTRFPRK